MTKLRVEYHTSRVLSPISFWVHRPLAQAGFKGEQQYQPPMPAAVLGQGFPLFVLTYRGQEFLFASVEEIQHCRAVLLTKALPAPQRLVAAAGYPGCQHLHWLTRWPGHLKSWRDRVKIAYRLAELETLALSVTSRCKR